MPAGVWLLTLAQALSMSIASLMVFAGGIMGSELSADPAWATLPVALLVVGTALGVMPAARLMHYLGRRVVFIAGATVGVLAALVAAVGIRGESFVVFSLSGLLLGTSLAVAQQYRFAAMELVAPSQTGRAAARVLLGGLVAAYLGPELVVYGGGLVERLGLGAESSIHLTFVGAFLLLSAVCTLALIVIAFGYRDRSRIGTGGHAEGRPLAEVVRNPLLWLAIIAAAMGYAMMSFMMTATPLNMHKVIGYGLLETKWVIQSHIIAMFLPSFVSGWLITKLGHWRVIAFGVLAFVVCLGVAASGHELMHYWWALVLLGVGWNFLFVGGTALLPHCHRIEERFKAQSLNEFTVFGCQAVAALSAGWVLSHFGWNVLLTISTVMVAVVTGALWRNRGAAPGVRVPAA
ncbi:MAG: MFS transporter [Gammaproteobacteria bacterium]|nr:MFS transporter [Gammaproteobacteria bacterium]